MAKHYDSNKRKIRELWETDEIQEWKIDSKSKPSLDWNSINFNKKFNVYKLIYNTEVSGTRAEIKGEILLYNFPDQIIPFIKCDVVLDIEEGRIIDSLDWFDPPSRYYTEYSIRREGENKYILYYWIYVIENNNPPGVFPINFYITILNPKIYYEIRKNKA